MIISTISAINIYLKQSLNLNVKSNLSHEEVIEEVIKNRLDSLDVEIEVIFGIETLKALENAKEEWLTANVTINLDKVKKRTLLKGLNEYHSMKSFTYKEIYLKFVNEKDVFFDLLIDELNTLDDSPLKGRISPKDEGDFRYKVKREPLLNVLKKDCALIRESVITVPDAFARILINALNAHKKVYKEVYDSQKEARTRMCDVRYVVRLLPYLYQYTAVRHQQLTVERICEIFNLIKSKGSNPINDYLDGIKSDVHSYRLVKKHAHILMYYALPHNPVEEVL